MQQPKLFTYDEVCAMQFARRILVRSMPGMGAIERALAEGQLKAINSALNKMEENCDA